MIPDADPARLGRKHTNDLSAQDFGKASSIASSTTSFTCYDGEEGSNDPETSHSRQLTRERVVRSRRTGDTSSQNYELRSIRVVTLYLFGPTTELLKHRQPRTMRYDAIGCRVPAYKEVAALFEARSPIHEDRNESPQPIERMGVLPPAAIL